MKPDRRRKDLGEPEGGNRKPEGGADAGPANGGPASAPFWSRPVYRAAWFTLVSLGSGLNRLRQGRRKAPAGRPLRVLRVVSSVAQGGVAKVVVQTVPRLDPAAVETRIAVFGKKHKPPELLTSKPGVEVERTKLELNPAAYLWRSFPDLVKLARVIRRHDPDLVHLHEPQFAAAAEAAAGFSGGRPVAVHLHSVYRDRRAGISPVFTGLERRALRRLPAAACSRTIEDGAREWIGPGARVRLIEDGADDLRAWESDPGPLAELRAAAGDRLVVCKMARVVPLKNVPHFIDACRILIDEGFPVFALLLCYGKDKDEDRTREGFMRWFTPETGMFLYRVRSVPDLLPGVSIGVSASRLEGLGLNVLEYQTAGIPVACTDIPAHREMVEDGRTGLLFDVDDLPGLVRQLRRLVKDEELRRRLGEAGREAAAKRTWERTAAGTMEWYRDVMRGKA